MDKSHADSIAISEILDKLQIQPEHIGNAKALYRSPISKEKQPSFWVYFKTNTWYDYAIPAGGDLQEFACRYLKFTGEAHTPADVMRWTVNMSGNRLPFADTDNNVLSFSKSDAPVLIGKSAEHIRFMGLIRYLEGLGIPVSLACRYAKELKVFNRKTGKTFIAIGVLNENGGYNLYNPFFNGSIAPYGITFFRGASPRSRNIHVFKNIFDFLSVLTRLGYQAWEHDTIILHANSNAQLAAPYVRNYGYKAMYTWMDNDESGRKATAILHGFLLSQPGLVHLKMNRVYEDFHSVNAWHVAAFRMPNQPV